MREIKYRAWNKTDKLICWVWAIDFHNNKATIQHKMEYWDYSLNELELMQYTWLKDCKWNEIYFDDYVKTILHIYQIKQSKFTISLVNISNWDIIELTNKLLDNLTIIWNIYENKESDVKKYCCIQKNS